MIMNRLKVGGMYCGGMPVATDQTDHIHFLCPECYGSDISISDVYTKSCNSGTTGGKVKCTYIIVRCNICGGIGKRKFYWRENGWHENLELPEAYQARKDELDNCAKGESQ